MSSDSHATGCLRVEPPLNEDERDHLVDLLDTRGTLRGTPTGRGDHDVPFARLAWVVCPDGCCLEWEPSLEDATFMAATLRFVVDHLLRPGAKGEGRGRFTGFTFDHVVSGAVMARPDTTGTVVLVQAEDNRVTERSYAAPCDAAPRGPFAPTDPGPRPPNVLVFRPRGA